MNLNIEDLIKTITNNISKNIGTEGDKTIEKKISATLGDHIRLVYSDQRIPRRDAENENVIRYCRNKMESQIMDTLSVNKDFIEQSTIDRQSGDIIISKGLYIIN